MRRKNAVRKFEPPRIWAWPEVLIARHLATYREMHALLRKAEAHGKDNAPFDVLARRSRNAGELIAMHNMPKRETALLRMLHGWMDEYSARGVPTPKVVLDFNRELCGTNEVKSDIPEKYAIFYQCIREDRTLSNKRIAAKIGKISPTTIAKWRRYPGLFTDLKRIRRCSPEKKVRMGRFKIRIYSEN